MTTPKTETKSLVLLTHHLKQLKLPTMNAECEPVAQRCARENVDHLGFLLQLCELELIERERKSGERRLKSARFPAYKTLDEFDFDARPSVNKPLVLELARGDYLDQRQNVLFVGNSGTGKTHLATGLAVIACAQGKRVRFWRVTELITTVGSQGRTLTLAVAGFLEEAGPVDPGRARVCSSQQGRSGTSL
jgi:DNA replication protein DnaC